MNRANDSGLPIGRKAASRRTRTGFVAAEAPSDRDAGTLISDSSEGHVLTIAPTGAGKGVSVGMPMLLSHPGAAIVIDLKGEFTGVTGRFRLQSGQRVCVVDPFGVARLPPGIQTRDTINPLQAAMLDSEDLSDDAASLAELIAGEAPRSLQDPFWRQLALDLLTALIGWVWVRAAVTGKEHSVPGSMADVWALLHEDDLAYALAVILDTSGRHPALPAFVYRGFVNFIHHEADKVRTYVVRLYR